MARRKPIKNWEELKTTIEYLRERKHSIIEDYDFQLEEFRSAFGDNYYKRCGEVFNLERRCEEFLEQYPDNDKERQKMERRLKVPRWGNVSSTIDIWIVTD